MQNTERIVGLIRKYLSDEISVEEREEVNHWVAANDFNRQVFHELTIQSSFRQELIPLEDADFDRVWNKIVNETRVVAIRPKQKLQWKYLAAASVVICILVGSYFWFNADKQKEIAHTQIPANPYKNDIAPGTDKAILTLSDGSTIQLDNSGHKKIAEQNGTAINQQGAHLVYETNPSTPTNPLTLSYNILSTPRGGQYQVVLPDGSKVWLNAVSSIRFPTAFMGKERNVEITGEAYFEVAHDALRPFKVSVHGMEVQVLGTHFNLNSYSDETSINTALLEGAVKVSTNSSAVLLKPGQQAQLRNQDQLKVVENTDMDAVIAWKNGLFYLNDADIPSVLRQVSRWYDVDVEYRNGVPQGHLSGKVPRNMNLSQILKVLEYSEVNFKLEGRKLIVMP